MATLLGLRISSVAKGRQGSLGGEARAIASGVPHATALLRAGGNYLRGVPLRETTFIRRNVPTWRRLEREVVRANPDPDVLRDLYASVSDDLSYARTHYPHRSVKAFLNHKAASLALSLYRNRRRGLDLRRFFLETVPFEMYAQRVALRIALAVFVGGFVIGWFSSVADPGFARAILSDGYVEQTIDNIDAGDPMAIYKRGSMLGNALGIIGNNLRVALLCFVAGVTWGAGALLVCLHNAVMVGTFQQFFFARGVGFESVLGIWTHGTIEISCIIVACGAGLALARGIIWPGTFTRARAFQLSARAGLRIMAGIAPLIVVAGVIEGFVTRLTDLPTLLRLLFLAANLAVVVAYLIVLPVRVGRGRPRTALDYGGLPPDRPLSWTPHQRLPTLEGFFDTFRYFGSRGLRHLAWAFGLGALLLMALMAFLDATVDAPELLIRADAFSPARRASALGIYSWLRALPQGLTLLAAAVVTAAVAELTRRVHADLPWADPVTVDSDAAPGTEMSPARARATMLVGLAVPLTLLTLSVQIHPALMCWAFPLLALWARGVTYQRGNVAAGLRDAWTFGTAEFSAQLLLTIALLATGGGLFALHDALWVPFGLSFVALSLPAELWGEPTTDVLRLASALGLSLAYVVFCLQAFGLAYTSARESYTATGLAARIESQFA